MTRCDFIYCCVIFKHCLILCFYPDTGSQSCSRIWLCLDMFDFRIVIVVCVAVVLSVLRWLTASPWAGSGSPLHPGSRGTFRSPAPDAACCLAVCRSRGVAARSLRGRRTVQPPVWPQPSPGFAAPCRASAARHSGSSPDPVSVGTRGDMCFRGSYRSGYWSGNWSDYGSTHQRSDGLGLSLQTLDLTAGLVTLGLQGLHLLLLRTQPFGHTLRLLQQHTHQTHGFWRYFQNPLRL